MVIDDNRRSQGKRFIIAVPKVLFVIVKDGSDGVGDLLGVVIGGFPFESLPLDGSVSRVADESRRPADQGDRLVAETLEMNEADEGEQVADVKTRRGRVETAVNRLFAERVGWGWKKCRIDRKASSPSN